jgi:hypothetical protein
MLMHYMAYPPVEFTYLLMNDESRLRGGYAVYCMGKIQGKEGAGVCRSRALLSQTVLSLLRMIYEQGKCSQK